MFFGHLNRLGEEAAGIEVWTLLYDYVHMRMFLEGENRGSVLPGNTATIISVLDPRLCPH